MASRATRIPQFSYERVGVMLRDVLLVGGIVFAAATLGILSRPIGMLAAFWPANALLLGLFVRIPSLARPAGWIAAFAGFMAADLLAGGEMALTLWMTAANLIGVAVGFILFQQLPEADRRLQRPLSILYMFGISMIAGAASAIVGSSVAAIAQGVDLWRGTGSWFSGEIVNYTILLPVILTVSLPLPAIKVRPITQDTLLQIAPLIALIVSAVASVAVGGPGAIAFPVPALLWCALTYNLFTTVLLTMAYSVWKMAAFSTGVIDMSMDGNYIDTMLSIRLGITLLALGPLTVASISAARRELMQTLDRSANYDYLTGALTRSAFMDRGQQLCEAAVSVGDTIAMLALDIDQFKKVNDSFGHAAGDRVLIAFAAAVARTLRDGDLFGRLGGEEFAIVLPNVSDADALALSERIRAQVEAAGVTLDDGQHVSITVSIGLVNRRCRSRSSIDAALAAADQALYAAKAAGRNRVVVLDAP
ncbi:MAG: diguanylate cyclase [Chloroflexia bacterium]|nr:diguanylate cyclase [Chloroflexia bacterium]